MNEIPLIRRLRRRIERWRGHPVVTDLGHLDKLRSQIEAIQLKDETNEHLRQRGRTLRRRARAGASPEALRVPVFALAAEAARRRLGLSPHPVQMLAALALSEGCIAEIATGEGKTLIAVFPACLNAITGRGVHVFTANDYLARRDAAWMAPVYDVLGLTVGTVQEGMDPQARKRAYAADVTYATAKEAGFDYLRDRLRTHAAERVQRPFAAVIVDEADFIMIDEARAPLVIAGTALPSAPDSRRMAELARTLVPGREYLVDRDGRNVHLTDRGLDRAEKRLACGPLHDPGNQQLFSGLNLALHAQALLRRDVDYLVRGDRVELVDEFTGRVAEGRRWPDGIQAAVEAKEDLEPREEGRILASITLQHFLRLYPRICGMTATAVSAAEEFKEVYGLPCVPLSPHRPSIRRDLPDRVFATRECKWNALVAEIGRLHRERRPVLVGTRSVEESETLAGKLNRCGVTCRVLNARNHEAEAAVVAHAGEAGAVTISTNMAGRGTDIRLGGPDEKDRQKVIRLGGLAVLGTNRHESRRIDLQLAGRAGRQGDPGSSCFFLSLEDDLFLRYGLGDAFKTAGSTADAMGSISVPAMHKEITRAQRAIEAQNFTVRQTLFQYSRVVEAQRLWLDTWRESLLDDAPDAPLREFFPPGPAEAVRAPLAASPQRTVARILRTHLDHAWSDHLAHIADIREGIHLVSLAGRLPLEEFTRRAADAFELMRTRIVQAAVADAASLETAATGREGTDPTGIDPSSTWTYTVGDNPFSGLGTSLHASRNIGYAVGSLQLVLTLAPFLPLIALARTVRKILKKGRQGTPGEPGITAPGPPARSSGRSCRNG